jgi:hypothetical protein
MAVFEDWQAEVGRVMPEAMRVDQTKTASPIFVREEILSIQPLSEEGAEATFEPCSESLCLESKKVFFGDRNETYKNRYYSLCCGGIVHKDNLVSGYPEYQPHL